MSPSRLYVAPFLDSVPLLASFLCTLVCGEVERKGRREKGRKDTSKDVILQYTTHGAHCKLNTCRGSLAYPPVLWKRNPTETIHLEMIRNHPENLGDSLP